MNMPSPLRLPGAVVLIFFIALSVPGTVLAATVLTPGIQVRAEYDDNVLFSRENQLDDLIARFNPSLGISYRTEKLSSDTLMSIDVQRYIEESQLSREDIFFDTGLDYRATERFSTNANFSYRLDSTLESELDETGLVVGDLSDRQRISGGGGVVYYLTELQNLEFNFSLGSTDYDRETSVDYDSASVDVRWNRSLRNQRGVVTLQPYWSETKSDVSQVDTYGLLVGWARRLTEKWTLSAFLGGRYTTTEYSLARPVLVQDTRFLPAVVFRIDQEVTTEEESDWGGVADISLTWTNETWNMKASFNRDLSYSTQGDPIDRDRFGFSVGKNVSKRFAAHMDTALYFTQNEGRFSEQDSTSFRFSPHIVYRITEDHRFRAGYIYSYFKDDAVEDSGRNRNRVWVSLDFTFPRAFNGE